MDFKSLFKKKNKSDDAEFVVAPKVKRKPATIAEFKIGVTIKAIFFFLLTTVSTGVFAYIIYHSTGLHDYQHYVVEQGKEFAGLHVWNIPNVNAPNANNIFILFWVGMACLIITFLMICAFGLFTWLVPNKKWQTSYVFAIIILAALGVLFLALSQYFYAKFYDFYLYEANTTGVNKKEWAKKISETLSNDYNAGHYDWMQSAIVWWVMFVQFMFLFGIGISLQNALNDNSNLNDYEKYISDSRQVDAGASFGKVNKFFKNMFTNNDKNTAKFLIIISLVIVIPNFVYSVIGTVETSNMQSVIAWSYKVPDLLQDSNLPDNVTQIIKDLNGSKYGSIFLVLSLQIILEGITIATLFFFITMLLRGKNVSNRIFIVESAILFVELIALISVSLASKIYVYRLADFWQSGDPSRITNFVNSLSSNLGKDFDSITKMYPLNGMENTNHIYIEWLDKYASIAEAIIAYAWVFGNFAIETYNIYKLGYFKKANSTTYKSGIFNS